LAHTIREIEDKIFEKHAFNYLIKTRIHEDAKTGMCHFDIHGCTIYLAKDASGADVKDVRLRLAHELGHIALNIDNLSKFIGKRRTEYPIEEEADAWEFAYHLLWEKSESYKNEPYRDFKYSSNKELQAAIIRLAGGHGEKTQKVVEKRLSKT